MRRSVGFVLFTVGVVAIALAPMIRFYSLPRVKKIPNDFYFREVADGTGTYVDPAHGFAVVGPVPVRNVTIQKGDPSASTKSVAVWDQFSSLFDTENHHEITYDIDRLTLQRTSAASVNCCGQNEERTGSLTALFPIGTEKKSYPFWDENGLVAAPATYQDTETLDGLSVYRFHQHVPETTLRAIKLPESVLGGTTSDLVDLSWIYTADTDIWVEPVTGGIVKASQVADQWFADAAGNHRLIAAHIDAGWNDATVKDAVDTAASQKDQIALLERTIPVVGLLAGIVLTVAGLLLLRSRKPESERGATEAEASAA